MKKGFGYIRVSTDTQERKGYGLAEQERAIKEYCTLHKIELIQIFHDHGISGTEEDRAGLTDLLANLNGIKNIIVLNTSRLWRDDFTKVFVKRELMKLDADITSIEQPNFSIYNEDPNDFLINGMMELLDQYERMTINLRLAKGKRARARAGNKAGGVAPLGYVWQHDGLDKPQVIIDPDTAPIIELIFSKYLEHGTLGQVKKHLDQHGYKTNRGNNFSTQAIRNILTNDFYKGIVTHGEGIEVAGQHEPIINPITFGRVQAQIKRRAKK